MCEPVTISMGVMAAASATAAIVGQQQQKKAAKSYEDQQSRASDYRISETRKRATDDYLNQVRLEQTQQRQEQEAVVEKSADLARQGATTVATGEASAAERGLGGGRTVEAILADYRFQEELEIGRMDANQKLKDQQHSENLRSYETRYYNAATSVQPYQKKPIGPVDYFTPVFGAIGQTMSTGVNTGAFKGMMSGSKAPSPPSSSTEVSWSDMDIGDG
jgi:hypothetical protein